MTIILAAFLANPTAQGASICSQPEAFRAMKHSSLTIDKYRWSVARSTDVIALGESHFTINQDTYLKILSQARNSLGAKPCLFLEFPNLGTAEDLFKFIHDVKIPKSNSDDLRRANERTYDYYHPLSVRAQQLGYQVYVIDDPRVETAAQGEGPDLNERDNYMASRIAQLMANRQCSKAISINGKAHLTSTEPNRNTLNHRLNQLKVKTVSVSMHSPTDWNVLPTYELSISGLCNEVVFTHPANATVMAVKNLLPNTPMYPEAFSYGGTWDDFQIAVLDSY